MRRSFAWIAATLALVLIAGCSSQTVNQPQPNTGTKPAQNTPANTSQTSSGTTMVDTAKFKKNAPYKIHWAAYWTGHPWMKAFEEHIREEFAKYKEVEFTVSDGQNKKEKLIADIEDVINKKPDLLIVTSGDADSPRDVVARAVQKGIPVLSLQKVINGDEMTAKVLGDDVAIAREQAKSMVEALTKKNGGPKGTYAIMAGVPGASNTNDRYKGFKEVLDQYPDIKKVADQTANFRRDQGRSLMENWMQGGQKVDAVLTMADEMAIGAALAVRDANKVGQYIIIGANAQTEALQLVQSGEIYSSYLVPDAVDTGIEIALKIMKGEPIPYVTLVNGEMVDQKNVTGALNPKCFVYRGPAHKQHAVNSDHC